MTVTRLSFVVLLSVLLALAGAPPQVYAQSPFSDAPNAPRRPVSRTLVDLHRALADHRAKGGSAATFTPQAPRVNVSADGVVIDALARDDAATLRADLEALGLTNAAAAGRIVSGRLPIDAVDDAAALASLHSAWPALPIRSVGATTSQGVEAMQTQALRDRLDVDGSGVTVGFLSDSFDAASGTATTADDDVASGDLPGIGNPNGYLTPVQVIDEADSRTDNQAPLSDEGRAMAQIIHDVAPGAALRFHTAFDGLANFAQGIRDLADDGADVIVDDILFLAEPMFQDGVIAQAVDDVVFRDGVVYLSSAGNNGTNGYASPFRPSGVDGPQGDLHDFDAGPGTDVAQRITIAPGATVQIALHWAQPAASVGGPGASTDLDIVLLDQNGGFLAAERVSNLGGDPVDLATFRNDGSIDADGNGSPDTAFQVVIERVAGPAPDEMRYVFFSSGGVVRLDEFDAPAPTLYGHPNARGAIAVAAAAWFNTPTFNANLSRPVVNDFTSFGGLGIRFDELGRPLPQPEDRGKPDVTGPDGGNTTFFGQPLNDNDSFPNFFGTSAAAPHLAGVAALILESAPDRRPDEIAAAFRASAIDIRQSANLANGETTPIPDGVGVDAYSGAGFVRADQIVLPDVELTDFRAAAAGNQSLTVSWEEASSADVETYRLQRSFFGSDFQTVTTTPGGQGRYSVQVDDLDPGIHDLRLLWTRGDGSEQADGPRARVRLEIDSPVAFVGPYPNPATQSFTLEVTVRRRQGVVMAMYDRLGRQLNIVFSEFINADRPRIVTIETDQIASLGSGLYFVRVVGEEFDEAVPVTIVR